MCTHHPTADSEANVPAVMLQRAVTWPVSTQPLAWHPGVEGGGVSGFRGIVSGDAFLRPAPPQPPRACMITECTTPQTPPPPPGLQGSPQLTVGLGDRRGSETDAAEGQTATIGPQKLQLQQLDRDVDEKEKVTVGFIRVTLHANSSKPEPFEPEVCRARAVPLTPVPPAGLGAYRPSTGCWSNCK